METNEEVAPTDSAESTQPTAREAFEAALAAERADAGRGDDEGGFAEGLRSEGIDVTVKPREEAPEEVAEEASEEPAADAEGDAGAEGGADAEFESDGLDVLTQADTKTREGAMAETQEIEEEAAKLGLPDGLARALGRNVPRKEAREFLESQRRAVQSATAGQSDPSPSAPTGYEAALGDVSEVLRSVESEAGEATAKAVADIYGRFSTELQQVRELAMASVQEQQISQERAQWMDAADGLSERFPGLVRGGKIDPAVAEYAAAFHDRGPHAGNKLESLSKASELVYGAVAKPTRQPTTATPSKSTPTPNAPRGRNEEPMTGAESMQRLQAIEVKYRNDPEGRAKAYAAEQKYQASRGLKMRR